MINPLEIIRKYYTLDSLAGQSLLIHSQLVRDKAQALAIKHPEMDLDIPFIQEAAMLHDIGIFLTKAPDIGCFGEHPYICHGYLGADLLRAEGLPRHALVCERHTGAGISLEMIKEQHLPLPLRDMLPITLEEKLIAFADKFYSKTNLTREKKLGKIRQKWHFLEKKQPLVSKNGVNFFFKYNLIIITLIRTVTYLPVI